VGIFGIVADSANKDAASKVNILRMFRVARIIRVAKILKRFPVLNTMVSGFAGAMQAMLWGLILILVLLVMWSILAVEVVHPINHGLDEDDYCRLAFSSVFRSVLLFFQTLVAGDSWGACAIPIITHAPWTYIIFSFALVTVQLGFTNLVLAVIVDKAAEAREGSKADKEVQKKAEEAASMKTWREAMSSLDLDGSCTVNKAELLSGFNTNLTVKKTLEDMDIYEEDLEQLFHIMDFDDSGCLDYCEFVHQFYKAQTQDPRAYLMIMRLHLEKMEHRISRNVDIKLTELMQQVIDGIHAPNADPPPPVYPADHERQASAWRKDVRSEINFCAPPPPDWCGAAVAPAPGDEWEESASSEVRAQKLGVAGGSEEPPSAARGGSSSTAALAGSALGEQLHALGCRLEARLDTLLEEAREAATWRCRASQAQMLQPRQSPQQRQRHQPANGEAIGLSPSQLPPQQQQLPPQQQPQRQQQPLQQPLQQQPLQQRRQQPLHLQQQLWHHHQLQSASGGSP